MNSDQIIDLIIIGLIGCLCIWLCILFFKYAILPNWLRNGMTEIERNPVWITSRLHDKYYGFHDIDFVLCESKLGGLPNFRSNSNHTRLELWINKDTYIDELDYYRTFSACN